MDKNALLRAYQDFLEYYDLKQHEAVLTAGGAMIVHDLIDTTKDVDLDVPQDIYDYFRRLHATTVLPAEGDRKEILRIALHGIVYEIGLLDEGVEVDQTEENLRLYSVRELLRYYMAIGRRKDREKIDILTEVVASSN